MFYNAMDLEEAPEDACAGGALGASRFQRATDAHSAYRRCRWTVTIL